MVIKGGDDMSRDEKIFSCIYVLARIVEAHLSDKPYAGDTDSLSKLLAGLSSLIKEEQEIDKSAEIFGFDVLFPGLLK